jgi:hypothetical protein
MAVMLAKEDAMVLTAQSNHGRSDARSLTAWMLSVSASSSVKRTR